MSAGSVTGIGRTRRSFLGALVGAVSTMWLSSCAQSAPLKSGVGTASTNAPGTAVSTGTGASANVKWEQLLESAKREGVVKLHLGLSGDVRSAVVDSFQNEFLSIKVDATIGPASA